MATTRSTAERAIKKPGDTGTMEDTEFREFSVDDLIAIYRAEKPLVKALTKSKKADEKATDLALTEIWTTAVNAQAAAE